ncbi:MULTISPECIES: hypothetical protein [Brevibacillus]|jgi:hypothetical protein|nr:hypothetical protein [Brevibacillus borstelensis]MBE5396555.1 hypothetical protein [Brevibacillus borstelensis]MED1747134.1 hypothetical protein [Brevibacillus borstelensis]MED1883230.1 hypothetical protein [Brevibacillus borstelensis]RNB65343.1 hypothetical protein EDM54_03900 [Brevibacillus borstelensis]GED54861.1 hypothetical protein BBO01nite_41020 [Brevibacillus borstelensis]
MGFDLGLIIALALAAAASMSDFLRIPKKLRGWVAMVLILGLYMVNQWIYSTGFDWRIALLEGGTAALAAVGIHSTAKNTMQQVTLLRKRNGQSSPPAKEQGETAASPGSTSADWRV